MLMVAPVSQAGDSSGSPSVGNRPIEVTTAILMTNIWGLNMASGTFNATFYVSLRCEDPCNRSDWDILNAQSLSKEVVSDQPGETWWLVSGTFTFEPNVRLFPFDTQTLPIKIEDQLFSAETLVFVPDVAASEVAPEVKISGWDREPFSFSDQTTAYQSLGAEYSRVTFSVPVSRSTMASVTKYYLPLVIFVLVSVATLALRRFEVQISTGAAGLVGVTVFYLATGTGMGPVGYVTVWDLSILVGYIVLGLVLACGVIGTRRSDAGDFEGPEGNVRSRQLRKRFLGVIISILAITSVVFLGIGALT